MFDRVVTFGKVRAVFINQNDLDFAINGKLKYIYWQGPYKQYMGRSKMTGNLTLVLYEDPEDGIPKIHVRSSRYMAWIAEMMLPTYLHVDRVRTYRYTLY